MPLFAGAGVTPSLRGLTTGTISLAAGEVWLIQPAGWYEVKPGQFTALQEYDPITTIWRTIGAGSTSANIERIYSDGVNYRLANQTGCAVGAVVTNAGTGYTAAPTVTPSAGASKWQAILGGAINTSVTVSNGGTNYTYPPIVLISSPGPAGIQASAHATISGGIVTAVTVDNQGAGYTSPPTVTFVNDPREGANGTTVGSNAAAITTLTGAGTVTGLLCLDHGTPLTAVPTLTFSPASTTAATVAMCWTITAYAVSATTAGSGYVSPVIISAYATPISGSVLTNPFLQSALVKQRRAFIVGALATGAITATGQTILDGGVYDQVPTAYVQSANVSGAGPVAGVFLAPTMGGVTDTSLVLAT